jgi:hypothetical protein
MLDLIDQPSFYHGDAAGILLQMFASSYGPELGLADFSLPTQGEGGAGSP